MIAADQARRFFEQAASARVLVVGDLMLDRYLWGSVSRISPEAPVPVVDVIRSEGRPGGAANVALNLASMGAQVSLCGVIGDDEYGDELLQQLEQAGFETSLVTRIPARKTTAKTRIIANHQQVLRVDYEDRDQVDAATQTAWLTALATTMSGYDAVVFEDYDKGVLSADLIAGITQLARQHEVPTVVDPKYKHFLAYTHTSLFKPNLKELNEALNLRLSKQDREGIVAAVAELRDQMPHAATLITLSEEGVLVVDQKLQATHVPAHYRQITDVSGAGDTVIAIMALAMAAGLALPDCASIANLAGGLVCEEVGVVPISPERLRKELGLKA